MSDLKTALWENKLNQQNVIPSLFKKLNFDGNLLKKLLFCLLFILYASYSYSTYIVYQTTKNDNLQRTSDTLEDVINDIFSNYSLLMRYMGTRIAEHNNPNDLEFIKKILESITAKEYNEKRILSSSLFDWVSAQDKIVVSIKTGIVKPTETEFFYRDYIPKCKTNPWVLHFSNPDIGKLSRSWIIPAGMGITGKNGQHLGILDTGFNIASLNNIIQKKLNNDSNSFIILDTSYNIVLKSSDNTLADTSSYYKNILETHHEILHKEGQLKNSIKHDIVEYNRYKKMDNYPYIILTGQNSKVITQNVFNTIFSLMAELSGVTLLFLIIFYHQKQKYSERTRAANKEKYKVIQKTSQHLKYDIDSIYNQSTTLSHLLNNKNKTHYEQEKCLALISQLRDTAESLKNFSILNVEMSLINIPELIQEVITIHSHNTFIKKIKLNHETDANILPIYNNELVLKQILISLISHSLESIPPGGTLKIKTMMEIKNIPDFKNSITKTFLKILLTDDGFGLTDDDMNRLSKKFSEKNDNDPSLINFDFKTILKLIKLHNGTYSLNCLSKGKMITLEFPYISVMGY